jgi:hypothetical protein
MIKDTSQGDERTPISLFSEQAQGAGILSPNQLETYFCAVASVEGSAFCRAFCA